MAGVLQVETSRRGPWVVLHVTGDVDLATAPVLRQAALSVVRDAPGGVLVDLTACHHLDSVGVGLLLGVHRRCRAHGGRLVVVADEPRVRRVLAATELDRIVPLAERLADVLGTEPGAWAPPADLTPAPGA